MENKALWKQAHSAGAISEDSDGFLTTAKEQGWRIALENKWGSTSQGLLRSIALNRISWKYLLPIESSWEAVDIGAGVGGIACQLGKECGMTAVDCIPANVEFMKIRAEQEGLSLFNAITADALSLPLDSGKYDLVSMVGTLEWIPSEHIGEDPYEVQLNALREIYRILKPNGYLYLAIENRDYLGYYLDIPEPHTQMKYVSLLDREVANQFSLDTRKQPYLEYTYAPDELPPLLKEAGFASVDSYWLHPDYAFTNYFIPLDSLSAVRYFVDELLNPWDFQGARFATYRFYRLMDAGFVRKHIEFLGFIAKKGDKC